MPFTITGMIASVQVLSSKGLDVVEANIKSGFSSGFPYLTIGTLTLKDGAGSGADLEPLAKNHEDYTLLRTLEKLTPALTPGSRVGPRFDHSLGWHSDEGIIFRPPAPFPGVRPRPPPAPAAPAPAPPQMPHVGCRARALR